MDYFIRQLLVLITPILLSYAFQLSAQTSLVDTKPPYQTLIIQPDDSVSPQIRAFYQAREGRPIWFTNGYLNISALTLLKWLDETDHDGLDSEHYSISLIGLLSVYKSDDLLAHSELMLTQAYNRLAHDLQHGSLLPRDTDPSWLLQDDAANTKSLEALQQALDEGQLAELLASLAPKHPGYLRLKQALADYRVIQESGGWTSLHLDDVLRPGDVSEAVTQLRRRLEIEFGQIPAPTIAPNLYDAELVALIRKIQQRFGLATDGAVGPITLAALNTPVETRINQLRINLERWRWLPENLGSRYLLVNTAGFDIRFHQGNQIIFNKRTINGRTERQTPSFADMITHVVINPTWTVPRSIAVNDLLPKQQLDSNFLTDKHIYVYQQTEDELIEIDADEVDWMALHEDYFPYVLRQMAGAANSLGQVKFHMPNPHAIYLHDTPSVGLFKQPARAYSSGCVRVESADQLARLMLDAANQVSTMEFEQLLDQGVTSITKLAEPIPVYLTYFTAWVDESGMVNFSPDIYQRDNQLMVAISDIGGHMTAQQTRVDPPASF